MKLAQGYVKAVTDAHRAKLSQASAAASEFYAALNKLIAEARREGVEEERKRQGVEEMRKQRQPSPPPPWANIFGPYATTTTADAPKPKPKPEPEPKPEKPLHVEVAEALGWTDCREDPELGTWSGVMPNYVRASIPPYDTFWSVTGPLIEKYGIDLEFVVMGWNARFRETYQVYGPTPLKAACNLILLLKDKGKL